MFQSITGSPEHRRGARRLASLGTRRATHAEAGQLVGARNHHVDGLRIRPDLAVFEVKARLGPFDHLDLRGLAGVMDVERHRTAHGAQHLGQELVGELGGDLAAELLDDHARMGAVRLHGDRLGDQGPELVVVTEDRSLEGRHLTSGVARLLRDDPAITARGAIERLKDVGAHALELHGPGLRVEAVLRVAAEVDLRPCDVGRVLRAGATRVRALDEGSETEDRRDLTRERGGSIGAGALALRVSGVADLDRADEAQELLHEGLVVASGHAGPRAGVGFAHGAPEEVARNDRFAFFLGTACLQSLGGCLSARTRPAECTERVGAVATEHGLEAGLDLLALFVAFLVAGRQLDDALRQGAGVLQLEIELLQDVVHLLHDVLALGAQAAERQMERIGRGLRCDLAADLLELVAVDRTQAACVEIDAAAPIPRVEAEGLGRDEVDRA